MDSALKKSEQDSVISSYKRTSFTHHRDEKTHTHTYDRALGGKKDHTHSRGQTYCTYTRYSNITATHTQAHAHTHTYTHALGVLSLMAARNESEKLTSPANTVHPV